MRASGIRIAQCLERKKSLKRRDRNAHHPVVPRYLSKQAEKQHNKLLSLIFKCLGYIVWCVEKCVKSRWAPVQRAIVASDPEPP